MGEHAGGQGAGAKLWPESTRCRRSRLLAGQNFGGAQAEVAGSGAAKPVRSTSARGAPCRPARPCKRVARQPAARARREGRDGTTVGRATCHDHSRGVAAAHLAASRRVASAGSGSARTAAAGYGGSATGAASSRIERLVPVRRWRPGLLGGRVSVADGLAATVAGLLAAVVPGRRAGSAHAGELQWAHGTRPFSMEASRGSQGRCGSACRSSGRQRPAPGVGKPGRRPPRSGASTGPSGRNGAGLEAPGWELHATGRPGCWLGTGCSGTPRHPR
jgi:hypothetical protein